MLLITSAAAEVAASNVQVNVVGTNFMDFPEFLRATGVTDVESRGVSLRSVYRFVENSDDLIRVAIARHVEKVAPLFAIDNVGNQPFEERLEVFVATRLRGYEAIASTARASRLRAATNQIIRDELEWLRCVHNSSASSRRNWTISQRKRAAPRSRRRMP